MRLGKSGLLTGAGGTGKSFLVREILGRLQHKGSHVALTATTGIAAVLIGGVTLMNLFRVVPDDLGQPLNTNLKRLRNLNNPRVFGRLNFHGEALRKIQTLVIDEVSMLDIPLFERVHEMLSFVHNNGRPFGGIQVIMVGDFFQLPPVARDRTAQFLFESKLFWETCDEIWELKEVWRQSDPAFVRMLQRIRLGEPTKQDLEVLQTRVDADVGTHAIAPTRVFSRNINVDRINTTELDKLEGHIVSYKMRTGEQRKSTERVSDKVEALWKVHREKFEKDINAPVSLDLKVGAQVLLTSNLDTKQGLCNGARGVVTQFRKGSDSRTERSFFESKTEHPVVRFESGKEVTIPFVILTRKLPDLGHVFVHHIPLRLAWASTIHRMQGQTVSFVDVALDTSIFETGQAYVALSRARSLDGLRLSSFDPACISAHPRVKAFHLKPFTLQKAEALMPPSKKVKTEDVGPRPVPAQPVELARKLVVVDDD